ncbi:hypothetical protein Pcinc_041190 [Petrolisthes cinctipes]|uniref:Uncharacterized protein n=1 Tax=Petrolisthes cinctipes TaxID=88211 RepID=A0AAE1BKP2_PETCI|nr:hypothetical protein Pcinc_041190 [Petrolisthes cinctipes]
MVMKVFKSVWCSRRRRAGRFNVHQANNNININALDKLPGVIRHNGSELFICPQVFIGNHVSGVSVLRVILSLPMMMMD